MIEHIETLQNRLKEDIEKRKEEALTTAALYIKAEEKRKAFLNRANYSLSLTHEYMDRTDKVINALLENHEPPQPCNTDKEEKAEKPPQSIRSIQFFQGKDAARAASIARAREKYDY